jgi:glycosyltransferase involved in cell wall biosynthesis
VPRPSRALDRDIQLHGQRPQIAVVLITLNEGSRLKDCLKSVAGWADQVFVVDSYSKDDTVDVGLAFGAHVVQRRFAGFGDQWNFALEELPISAPWTMKIDPDERVTNALKSAITTEIRRDAVDGMTVNWRLWFMGRPLGVSSPMLRVWRTGCCRFTDVAVNEHPVVRGPITHLDADLEHHDSPDLEHWLEKQNRYSTAEALQAFHGQRAALPGRLLGTSTQRRMWFKERFLSIPFRYQLLFAYNLLGRGAIRQGRIGWMWAHLRTEVLRLREYKLREMRMRGGPYRRGPTGPGAPDPRVPQY